VPSKRAAGSRGRKASPNVNPEEQEDTVSECCVAFQKARAARQEHFFLPHQLTRYAISSRSSSVSHN